LTMLIDRNLTPIVGGQIDCLETQALGVGNSTDLNNQTVAFQHLGCPLRVGVMNLDARLATL
jgi:hypothetical protein